MPFRQRVKTVTHVVELLNLVQNRIRVHEICDFPETLEKGGLQVGSHMLDKFKKRVRSLSPISGTLMNANQEALSVHRVFALAAPTRVSPAPATEQK